MDFGEFFDYPSGEERSEPEQELFLESCSDGDWSTIREHADARRFDAGAIVLSPRASDRALYLVLDGTVRVETHDQGRGRGSMATLTAGSVFGELSFLTGQPIGFAVRAVTEVDVLRLGLAAFEALAAKNP